MINRIKRKRRHELKSVHLNCNDESAKLLGKWWQKTVIPNLIIQVNLLQTSIRKGSGSQIKKQFGWFHPQLQLQDPRQNWMNFKRTRILLLVTTLYCLKKVVNGRDRILRWRQSLCRNCSRGNFKIHKAAPWLRQTIKWNNHYLNIRGFCREKMNFLIKRTKTFHCEVL